MKAFFKIPGSLNKPERWLLAGAAALFVLIAGVAAVSSYWMAEDQSRQMLARTVQLAVQNKVTGLEQELHEKLTHAQWLAAQPALLEPLSRLRKGQESQEARDALQVSVTHFLGKGVTGIAVLSESQQVLAAAGETLPHTELSLPLHGSTGTSLDWDDGPVLVSNVVLSQGQNKLGTLRMIFRVPDLMAVPSLSMALGQSAELALCAAVDANWMRCFPSRLNPHVVHEFPRRARGKPLPMSLALSGQSGFVQARDYRGQRVGAGFAPVGSMGLGAVFKVDTEELDAPLRQHLGRALAVFSGLALASTLALYWMAKPLLRRLLISEQVARKNGGRARNSEERTRAILDHVNQAIVTVNEDGRVESYNHAAQRIFGYPPEQVLAESIGLLIADWSHGTLDLQGESRGEVTGHRQHGASFPAEVQVSTTKLTGQPLHIIAVQDISERKAVEKSMRHLASHDALTGLANRILLQDRAKQAILQAERSGGHVGLLFIDLDNFKAINDTLGHSVGDHLLQIVAKRIQGCIREGDTVARQGGDEFIVVLSGATRFEDVGIVAGKILQSVSATYSVDGHELHTSGSIGVSVFPDDGSDVETLMRHADVAMYHAKQRGRANYQFFAPDMNRAANERMQLEGSLRNALEREEFSLHFQPIVSLGNNAAHGAEVLLRWNPETGSIGPDRFIPVAEETGLIVPIGEWVLRNACRQFKAWQMEGCQLGRVVVNLSVRQFAQKNLVAMVGRILQETGLEPQHLGLEITESLLMENPVDAIRALSALSDMGVEISIDDFGTGYSSLSYLKRFPIDKIKIDRSFVRDIASDPEDAAIVTAIIAMAHSLQCAVVAEGVETTAQLAFLRERGCDEYQGYLFSRPVPADELRKTFGGILAREGALAHPPVHQS